MVKGEIHKTWINHGNRMQLQYHFRISHLLNTSQSQNIVLFFHRDWIYLSKKLSQLLFIPLGIFILFYKYHPIIFPRLVVYKSKFYRTILLLNAKSESNLKFLFLYSRDKIETFELNIWTYQESKKIN